MRDLIEQLLSRIGIIQDNPIIDSSRIHEIIKRLLVERLDLRLLVESERCVPVYVTAIPHFPILKFTLLDKYDVYVYMVEKIFNWELYYFPSDIEKSCKLGSAVGYGRPIVTLTLSRRNLLIYKMREIYQILKKHDLVTSIKYFKIDELNRLIDPFLPVVQLFTLSPYYSLLKIFNEVSEKIRPMILTLLFRCGLYRICYKHYIIFIHDKAGLNPLPYLVPPYHPIKLESLVITDNDTMLFSPGEDNYYDLTLIPDKLVNKKYRHLLTTLSNYDAVYRIVSSIEKERSKYVDNLELTSKLEEAYKIAKEKDKPVEISITSLSPTFHIVNEDVIKKRLSACYGKLYLFLSSMRELLNIENC